MEAKTTIDAVNEFKAVWINGKEYIYTGSSSNRINRDSLQATYGTVENDQWDFICNEKQFNQCVEDCSKNKGWENIVDTVIDWDKAPSNCIGHSISTCFNGYWQLKDDQMIKAPDFGLKEIKFTPRPFKEESIPVYTQAMCDAGEKPSVGMKILAMYTDTSKDNAGILLYISDTNFIVDHVGGEVCYKRNTWLIKGIDTRTDEEKAIDDLISARKTCKAVFFTW